MLKRLSLSIILALGATSLSQAQDCGVAQQKYQAINDIYHEDMQRIIKTLKLNLYANQHDASKQTIDLTRTDVDVAYLLALEHSQASLQVVSEIIETKCFTEAKTAALSNDLNELMGNPPVFNLSDAHIFCGLRILDSTDSMWRY